VGGAATAGKQIYISLSQIHSGIVEFRRIYDSIYAESWTDGGFTEIHGDSSFCCFPFGATDNTGLGK